MPTLGLSNPAALTSRAYQLAAAAGGDCQNVANSCQDAAYPAPLACPAGQSCYRYSEAYWQCKDNVPVTGRK
jgi:hypothetical protein